MNADPSTDGHSYPDEDVLTFRQIAERIWSGRWLILLVPAFAIAAAVIYVMLSAVQVNSPVIYHVDLRNIENGRYPNGTEFSPSDLLLPEVRSELRRRFDLQGSPLLTEVITVTYGSPRSHALVRSFQERLANRNLTSAEIEDLNRQYQERIEPFVRASLTIEVNYRLLGVDAETGAAIARALPEIWTEVITTNYRVHADTGLGELSISRSDEDLRSTASVLIAHSRLQTIRRGLETIAQDNRLRSVMNSEGQTAEDLLQDLRNFQTIYFNTLAAITFGSDEPMANLYLAEIDFDIEEMRRQAAAYDRTLEEVRGVQRAPTGPEAAGQFPVAQVTDRELVQLSEGALSQILRISEQASFVEFMQERLLERQELMFRISAKERQRAMAAAESVSVRETASLRASAASILSDITRQYVDLLHRTRELLVERGGAFYETASGPMVTGETLFDRQRILMVTIAGFAGLVLALLLALLWPSIRGVRHRRA